MNNSKKRLYTFASGCKNIPDETKCNRAGATHGRGCEWIEGTCSDIENFEMPTYSGESCSDGHCMRWWNADSKEKFKEKQTHDGETCKAGHCMRWWRAK